MSVYPDHGREHRIGGHRSAAHAVVLAVLALAVPASQPARAQIATTAEAAPTNAPWSDMLGSVGQGLLGVVSSAGRTGWYVTRATTELFNVLGLNELDPVPAPRRLENSPYAALPPASGAEVPDAASVPRASTMASLEPREPDRSRAPNLAPNLSPAPIAIAPEVDTTPFAPKLGEGFVNDMPHKLPDGTLFVPKAAQRLYRLRTTPAEVTSAPLTVKLDGVVMHDPSRGGQVQTGYVGRLEVGDAGMPYLGMPVARGQILAWLRPTLTPLERATVRNDIARLTGDIVLAEKRIERLGQFFFVPFREGKTVYERLALASLQKQREALMAVLTEREAIRAPMGGTISAINHAMGQIAAARETVFEIVDPDALWVEAVAYNHGTVGDIVAASATTSDGTVVPLRYVGRGAELRQHAVLLHFRIESRVRDLTAGKPVRVVVQTTASEPGIVLPNESVVRTANGTDVVWEQIGPEQFVARHVSTRLLDSTRLYVVDGIDANKTVVTSSARLLSQFR